jgi:23S rRNA (uracil1939-C5)-methyltransferase
VQSSSETVEILRLAHAGDGVTADGLFVPYTVPGDIAKVGHHGVAARVEKIVAPGPDRISPPCAHFGRCGGCALQMLARAPYLAWKRELVVNALKQRGFVDAPVEEIRAVLPGTRRRAMFKARLGANGISVGFYEAGTRNLVDVEECPVLVPRLARLIVSLKAQLAPVLKSGETAELHATATDAGVDISLKLRRDRSPDLLAALAGLASSLRVARLSWNGEVVAVENAPSLRIGRFIVELPPESFLQPTREGEQILQTLVCETVGTSHSVADLFSGCGTFALALAEGRTIYAADCGAAQIDSLAAAAKAGGANPTAETRDLFRRPLLASELSRFDAVVLDPPRPGAAAQVQALAHSDVPKVIYVSCNPASFARDARTLYEGGYRLVRVVPLDQFLWSPHVELFAYFIRP